MGGGRIFSSLIISRKYDEKKYFGKRNFIRFWFRCIRTGIK